MDCFDHSTGFRYDPNPSTAVDGGSEVSGVLEIHVHHARNIHNICIYDNQDVYAKFSLTSDPDETLSTGIVAGGGKNPEFNEDLIIKIPQLDAVLKCEIWMLSRARNFMEDQLLGFVLVPVTHVAGKGKVTGDYTLSSTDLFHSPAGTVRLTLSLDTNRAISPNLNPSDSTSISSEVVLLESQSHPIPIEYSRIEFPDIGAVSENQKMVSEYVAVKHPPFASFLHLGASSSRRLSDDYEMGSNSGFPSSTTTSLSDDSNSGDKKPRSNSNPTATTNSNPDLGSSPDTPTSANGRERVDTSMAPPAAAAEEEQCAMQKQIVDMYMRSMHQFTESLANMKLPMDVDKPELAVDGGDSIQGRNSSGKVEIETKKKDGSRVFYGSRAFF